jgi:hypothetical protein
MANNKAKELQAIRELKWREVMSRVDAYRFYIKLCLEASAFFFATTGVILGFYLNGPIVQNYYLRFFLLLPILMGTVLGSICIYATRLQKEGSRIIEEVRKDLESKHLETEEVPDVNLLDKLLLIFGCIFFLVPALLISVPLLKETACLLCVDWFVIIACLILAGGVITTYFVILDYREKLNIKNVAKILEKSKKLMSLPATSEGKEQHNEVAQGEAQPTAGSNEQEANITRKK